MEIKTKEKYPLRLRLVTFDQIARLNIVKYFYLIKFNTNKNKNKWKCNTTTTTTNNNNYKM